LVGGIDPIGPRGRQRSVSEVEGEVEGEDLPLGIHRGSIVSLAAWWISLGLCESACPG
jgi:hypothetical protein